MATNAPPSVDPANQDSLEGVFSTILRKFLQRTDDMLPARVVSYDRTTNRATVQPVVSLLTTAGTQLARATVGSVPVLLLGGGGHMLSFNLQAGDLGWIKASDRDISMFLQSFNVGPPNTQRMHSFEDALFIPDAMRGYTIAPEDDSAVSLQTLDGTYKVVVGTNHVTLKAGATTFTLGSGGASYTGGPFIINGIPFGTHTHSGVEPGVGNTGVPNV